MAEGSVLLDHNVPVYEALEKMLRSHGKAIIVTAQGTGKSYLTLEYLNRHGYNALVICPKRSICAQWEKLSDRIATITYQKLCRGARIDGYDCYIFDEAHHCGSSIWGRATKALMSSTDKPVIGLTADSVRYLDGARDVAFDVWDGCVVYGSTPQEAIEAGILPSATYVYALYDAGEKIKKYRGLPVSQRLMARLEYSVRNCSSIIDIMHRHMPGGVRKGIVFVDSIDVVKDGVQLIRNTFPGMPVASIHTGWTPEENAMTLEDFGRAKSGYIVAVNMLNEGVHIPGVNTIIMLRKTASPTVFMQQLGRGLAAGADDIIVFDFVGNNCGLRKIGRRVEGAKSGSANPKIIQRSSQVIVYDYASEVLSVLMDIDCSLNGRWTKEEEAILRTYYSLEGKNVYKRIPGKTASMCRSKAGKMGLTTPINEWTPEEDDIIRKYYPSEATNVYLRLPGRTRKACKHRALSLRSLALIGGWTAEEDAILQKYYPSEGIAVSHRIPGRLPEACMRRAIKLGIQSEVRKKWTSKEDAIIRRYYSIEGGDVANRLPGRTRKACCSRAKKLGVLFSYTKWTPEEDAILQTYYPTEGGKVVSRLPGRSFSACKNRAKGLNIEYTNDKWTPEEDAIIRNYYPLEGTKVTDRLPGKSTDACKRRARKLNVLFEKRIWTAKEDLIIQKYYPLEGTKVALRLPSRTASACKNRAATLGIFFGKV